MPNMPSSSSTYHSDEPPSSPPSFDLAATSRPSPWPNSSTYGPAARTPISHRVRRNYINLTVLALLLLTLFLTLRHQISTTAISRIVHNHAAPPHELPQPIVPKIHKLRKHDPEEWLRKHTTTNYESPVKVSSSRPRAALISLVRNEELDGILQSMRQLEYLWNRRYQYPWIFFSETGFSEEFKNATTRATSSRTSYHTIPHAHWSTPPTINLTLFHDSLTYLPHLSVGKAHLLSYRHMCRWNSGFFFQHPALASYDYYWRVEPDVHFFCHLGYDVFEFMRANDLVYGFNMNILEDARSFVGLWSATVDFARQFPQHVHPDADWSWLVDDNDYNNGGGTGGYNNCQFFSNFEIGSLAFFRSEAYQAYFNHLDDLGGFYYERFGDAPIHTLAVSLFAAKEQSWFFRDVGYQHDAARHCPPADEEVEVGPRIVAGATAAKGMGGGGRCMCEQTRLDENFYRLVPMESPQRKPSDTCVRRWLGGEWLRKKDGWKASTEKILGGDGYGGYVRE